MCSFEKTNIGKSTTFKYCAAINGNMLRLFFGFFELIEHTMTQKILNKKVEVFCR